MVKTTKKNNELKMNYGITLSLKQSDCYYATEPFVLFGGAMGGGKSALLCYVMATYSLLYPGIMICIARYNLADLLTSTVKDFDDMLSGANRGRPTRERYVKVPSEIQMEKAIREGHPPPLVYWHNTKLNYYEWGNKSRVYFTQTKNPENIKSKTINVFLLEEASEIEQDFFSKSMTRIGRNVSDVARGLPKRIILTSNPESCWLYNYFLVEKNEGCRYIPCLPSENPGVDRSYLDGLYSWMEDKDKEKYLYGNWDVISGDDIVISRQLMAPYLNRMPSKEKYKRDITVVACDPALMGDDHAHFYAMRNGVIVEEIDIPVATSETLALKALQLLTKWDAHVFIADCSGGYAHGMLERVNANYNGNLPFVMLEFHGSSSGQDDLSKSESNFLKKRYVNLRACSFYKAKSLLEDGYIGLYDIVPEEAVGNDNGNHGNIIDTKALMNELSQINYKMSSGKIVIERKDVLKKKLRHSPNRADAFVLACWGTHVAMETGLGKIQERYSRYFRLMNEKETEGDYNIGDLYF